MDDFDSALNQLIAEEERKELNRLTAEVGVVVAIESLADVLNRVERTTALCVKTVRTLVEALERAELETMFRDEPDAV